MKKVVFFGAPEGTHPVHQAFANSVGAVNANSLTSPKLIREYDVAFVEGMAAMRQAVAAKDYHSTLKIIYHDADCFFSRTYPQANKLWRKMLYGHLLKNISGIISDSYLSASYAQQILPVPVKVVYPFVDVKRFSKVRANLKSKNVLFLGRFGHHKNSEHQVRAVKHTYYSCFAVGHGPYLERAMQYAPPNTTFYPWTEKPEYWYKKASIFLNVASYEPFGCAALEACVAGLIPLLGEENGNTEVLGTKTVVYGTDWRVIGDRIIEVMNMSLQEKKALQERLRKKAMRLTPGRQVGLFKKAFWSLA